MRVSCSSGQTFPPCRATMLASYTGKAPHGEYVYFAAREDDWTRNGNSPTGYAANKHTRRRSTKEKPPQTDFASSWGKSVCPNKKHCPIYLRSGEGADARLGSQPSLEALDV